MPEDKEGQEKEKDKNPWPTLPTALQHRMSMKWLTLEALRVLQGRLRERSATCRVMLFTAFGAIQGDLTDIADNYEESVRGERVSEVDAVSAVVHLRTELWKMYEAKDASLTPSDSGAVIYLSNVEYRLGNRRCHAPQMGLFASEVIGFTILTEPLPM